jgi:hydrogenase nickel incorporation protein HypA/HybF
VHELSIAQSLVEACEDAATRAGAVAVRSVTLRIGELSGVVPDALQFAFEVARADTLLDQAVLHVAEVPISVHCVPCDVVTTVGRFDGFLCGQCEQPCPEILSGRELEIVRIEIEEPEVAGAARR